jgi:pyruvate kinase
MAIAHPFHIATVGVPTGFAEFFGVFLMSSTDLSFTDSTLHRRAKIVATLGPASNTEPVFRQLVQAGLDVVRLNFSHGTHEEKQTLIHMIRKVSREEKKPLCILGDLQGPKIRTSKLIDHKPVLLVAGEKITITPRETPGTATLVGTIFKTLAENVVPGSRILLSDGLIELRVESVDGDDVTCEIINGGKLGENKGINLPGVAVRVPALTEKDEEDLAFALKAGVDAVAVSFVRSADDINLVRERIAFYGGHTWIIAKLEKPQAIEHLDSILQVADGIMVARGDLGVEVPPEKVPALQKLIIRRSADYRKPVITATQMLESMIDNPRPTRAEVSDVANAIYDGSDAVMLSGESAMGAYPVETVKMMSRIVAEAEQNIAQAKTDGNTNIRPRHKTLSVAETICEATAHAAEDLELKGIAIFTESGATAIKLSKYQPAAPIYAFSSIEVTINRLNLLWGVTPIHCAKVQTTEAMVELAETLLEQNGYIQKGEIIALIAGTGTKSGSTNFLRLHKLGDRIHRTFYDPAAAAQTPVTV